MKKRSKKALSEAALKAWATRRAMQQTSKQRSTKPRGAAKPPATTARLRADGSEDAYVSRVLGAMARTTSGDGLREASMVGKDLGGGWLVLGTDGLRALTRAGTSADTTPQKITEATPPPFGLTLTADLEVALRTLRRGIDTKHPHVRLEIDARRKRVVLRTLPSNTLTVPAVGELATTSVQVHLAKLLDGFGRGGRLGYYKRGEHPLSLDTPDGLRYVLMPMRQPKPLPKALRATA